MGDVTAQSASVALIAAMVTPALLIVASASLIGTALVRMARVVDRTRALAGAAHSGGWDKLGTTPAQLRLWLDRHALRAKYTEWTIALLYGAVAFFVLTCLSIAIDRALGESLRWLPVALAIAGVVLLLGGSACMVVESRLSGRQTAEEIALAFGPLERHPK